MIMIDKKAEKMWRKHNEKLLVQKVREEIEHFQIAGIPRCQHCRKNYIKVEEQSSRFHSTWKPQCKCATRDVRISIG